MSGANDKVPFLGSKSWKLWEKLDSGEKANMVKVTEDTFQVLS